MMHRRPRPSRHYLIIQKVKITGLGTLYLRVHDEKTPTHALLCVKRMNCSSGLNGLYGVIARLMCMALQDSLFINTVVDLLARAKFGQFSPSPDVMASSTFYRISSARHSCWSTACKLLIRV